MLRKVGFVVFVFFVGFVGFDWPFLHCVLITFSLAQQKPRPTLIFFGPNTDPDALKRLLPQFEQLFEVSHFDDVEVCLIVFLF